MASFLFLGKTWINVEQVSSVEFQEGQAGDILLARVYFAGGTVREMLKQDAQSLSDYLKAHRAS